MYTLPNGQKIKGFGAVVEYLKEQSDVVNQVRDGVLEIMFKRSAADGPKLEEVL